MYRRRRQISSTDMLLVVTLADATRPTPGELIERLAGLSAGVVYSYTLSTGKGFDPSNSGDSVGWGVRWRESVSEGRMCHCRCPILGGQSVLFFVLLEYINGNLHCGALAKKFWMMIWLRAPVLVRNCSGWMRILHQKSWTPRFRIRPPLKGCPYQAHWNSRSQGILSSRAHHHGGLLPKTGLGLHRRCPGLLV